MVDMDMVDMDMANMDNVHVYHVHWTWIISRTFGPVYDGFSLKGIECICFVTFMYANVCMAVLFNLHSTLLSNLYWICMAVLINFNEFFILHFFVSYFKYVKCDINANHDNNDLKDDIFWRRQHLNLHSLPLDSTNLSIENFGHNQIHSNWTTFKTFVLNIFLSIPLLGILA